MKHWMILLVVGTLLVPIVALNVSSDPPINWDWTIEGDTVFINNSWVYLSATPHTINSSGWVVFELESKKIAGELDAIWGFDSTEARPRHPQIWRNYTHNMTGHRYDGEQYLDIIFDNCISYERLDIVDYDNYTVDVGNKNNTKLWNLTFNYLVEGEWETVNVTIAFTSKTVIDADSIQFFYYDDIWTKYYYDSTFWDWKHFDKDITIKEYDWRGYDKWYMVNATVQEDKLYRVRCWVDVPFEGLSGTSGKYVWAIKEHSKTMQEAIDSGRLLYLDPWWLSVIHTYICDDSDAQGYEGSDVDGGFDGDIGEFTGTEYSWIEVDDDNSFTDTAGSNYQYHRFVFTITEDIADITQIDVTWKGWGGRTDGSTGHSLWVKESGSWSEKDSGTSGSKETLTSQKTSSFSDWITGGVLECAAQSDKIAVGMLGILSYVASYYVEVKVTYNVETSIHILGGHIMGGHIGG